MITGHGHGGGEAEGMQDQLAVTVEDTLGIAGGAGGVEGGRARLLVEILKGMIVSGVLHQRLELTFDRE